MSIEPLRIGLRLAVGRDRDARVRLAVTSVGVAIAVAVVLGGLGAEHAKQARDDRGTARLGQTAGARAADGLAMSIVEDAFGDRPFTRVMVAPIGDAPLPPGVDRIPAPGEVVASPAMRALLQGANGDLLRPRVGDRIIGEIAPEGLLEPRELYAYVGAERDALPLGTRVVRAFGMPSSEPALLDPEELALRQTMAGVLIGLMIPVLVLIWTSTRLSAARREERLATLRLIGGDPGQVRLIAAVEAAVGAAIGAALGVGVFFLTRWFAPLLLPPTARFFPTDLAPPIWIAVLVVVGTPVFAIAVSWLALRGVIRTPMRVRRGAARSPRVVLPAIVLTAGLGLWVTAARFEDINNRHPDVWNAMVLGAWVLTSLGILSLSPWIGRRAATLLGHVFGDVGTWLGARRLAYDGRAASRVTAGIVAVVFAASMAAGLLVIVDRIDGDVDGLASTSLRSTTVVVDGSHLASVTDDVSAVPGVDEVTGVITTSFRRGGVTVLVVDCRALAATMTFRPCAPGTISWSTAGDARLADIGGRDLIVNDVRFRPLDTGLVIPDVVPTSPLQTSSSSAPSLIVDATLLTPAALARLAPRALVVATDGSLASLEGVRDALADDGVDLRIRSVRQLTSQDLSPYASIRLVIRLGTIVGLLVAAASLLISTVGGVQERRKPLAALAATGASVGSLRRSVAVQTMVPLLGGVLLAAGAAAVAGWAVATIERHEVLPVIRPSLVYVGVAIVAGALVSLAALPSLRRGIRPDALHHE